MRRLVSTMAMVLGLGGVLPDTATAQVMGTFRWQYAPYCNVVSVRVEQKGAIYELSGTDDGCDGSQPAASANGSAHVNANSTVSISLTLVRPDGHVVNTTASISLGTFSGTWRDDWGNSGTFTFNPASPAGGTPRVLTMRGDWSVAFPGAAAQESSDSISFPKPLAAAPAAPAVNIIAPGGAPTTACPGTVANPLAQPGQVCLYQDFRSANVSQVRMFSGQTGTFNTANPTGVSVAVTLGAAGGNAYVYGRWAVTVP